MTDRSRYRFPAATCASRAWASRAASMSAIFLPFHMNADAALAPTCATAGTQMFPVTKKAAPYSPPTAAAHTAKAGLRPPLV
mgnify:CR=1 FL=1